MPSEFVRAAARQKQEDRRGGIQGERGWRLDTAIAIDDRVANEFDAQLRYALGIPVLFEREDTQEQVIIAGHLVNSTFTGSPNLRRNVLDDFWIPRVEPVGMRADCLFDCMRETAVESGEIHANDQVRLAV